MPVTPPDGPGERLDARRSAADAVRALVEQTSAADADPATWRSVADATRRLARELAAAPRRATPADFAESANRCEPPGLHVESPVSGTANALAPPMAFTSTPEGVTGTVAFGRAHEGPPDRVHGGWVAMVLDHAVALAALAAGHPAVTRSLTVEYLGATPLHAEVRVTGRVERVDGREVRAAAECVVGGVAVARASALLRTVDFRRLLAS